MVETREALRRAYDSGFDLVEISPESNPPVCRIMNYGKYIYTLKKKEKESRKHQKATVVKEVKFSIKIGEHDYLTKLNHCKEFFEKGNKVKVSMMLRGREMHHTDMGFKLSKRIKAELEEYANVEKDTAMEGNIISLMFAAKSGKKPGSIKGRTNEHGEENKAQDEKIS